MAVAVVHLRGPITDARHERVLASLARMLPRVGVEGRATFACDLRGTARLLGSPERVGERILSLLGKAKIPAAVGIAERPFVARVAAERAAAGDVVRVAAGEERAYLAALPLVALPLDDEQREELALLGIRSVAGFAALDRGAVLDRFGRAAAAAHALACGEDTGEVRGAPPRRRIVGKRSYDAPIDQREQLLFALKSLLDPIAARLAREGLAALRLEAQIQREDGGPLVVERTLLPPTAEAAALLRSLRWGLEEHSGIGRVVGVRVEVTEAEPARGRQLGLFTADGANEEEAIAVARYLRSRLGRGAVLRAEVADAGSPLAEREARWEEVVG